MKKSLFFFVFLVLLLGTFTAAWAATVTIGTGTYAARYPLNDYYTHSRSQCLYLQSEIGMLSGTITKLRWYRNDTGANPNAIGTTAIWLTETSATSLSGTTWITPGTQVATISNINLGSGGGWFEIDITDFSYFGGNLMVSVRTQNAPYTSPHSYWRYTSTASYMMLAGNSDTEITPSLSTSYSRPNIQMDIEPLAGYPGIVTSPNPSDTAAGVALSGDLSWTFGADTDTYDLWLGPTGSMVKVVDNQTAGATGSYAYSGLSADTEYSWQVVSRNASKADTNGPIWKFRTALPAGLIQIGTGTVTSNNLPINPNYGYSYSQVLYLQSEINVPDKRIAKLKYYWNGLAAGTNSASWTVYMGHTAKTAFNSTTDWIATSAMSQVFNGNVTLPASAGWVEITLTTPFVYDNVQNLVIAVDENTSNYDDYLAKFYGTTVSGARSLLYYSDSTNPDPASPPTAGYNYSAIANIRLQFEDIPAVPVFGVSPTSWDFGSVLIYNAAYKDFTISNTGAGTITLSSVEIDPNDTYYSIIAAPTDMELTAGESTTFIVEYFPLLPGGPHTGTVIITYSSGAKASAEIELTGEATPYDSSSATSTEDDDIGQFVLDSFANPATAPSSLTYNATSVNRYTDYTDLGPIPMARGTAIPVSITQINSGGFYPCYVKVFIDYNQNYQFDQPEEVAFEGSTSTSNPLTGTITVPPTALAGNTRLRVVLKEGGSSTDTLPIGTYTWGETEDYTVNIAELMADPSFSITPSSKNYGNVLVNNSIPQVFQITNAGGGTLVIPMANVSITGADAAQFVLTPLAEDISLVTGLSAQITVSFTPAAVASYAAILRIEDNTATKSRAIHEIPLSGEGFDPTVSSFPWTETFEADSPTRADWTQIQESGTKSWTYAAGSSGGNITSAYQGLLNARFTGSSRDGDTTKLVSPPLNLGSKAPSTLSFWYGQQYWAPDQNELKVYYRTSPTAEWNLLAHFTDDISVWTQVTDLELPNPSSTYQIAFEGIDLYGYANVVDAVTVTLGDSTVPVEFSSFTATFTADMYVQLTWVTQSETNMSGYYVLRAPSNNLVNAELISALIPASNTSETHTYQYKDSELFDTGTYYYWLECVEQGSSSYHGPISVFWDANIVPPAEIPTVTALNAIYPNPFNPIAYIPFSIGKDEGPTEVSFRIYNSRGQMVYSEALGSKIPGNYTNYFWDGRDSNGKNCATGVYFIRMTAGKDSFLRKAVLVK